MIIFAFRAVPLPGPGATWFEIDVLGFDQHFLSILTLITSALALVGMVDPASADGDAFDRVRRRPADDRRRRAVAAQYRALLRRAGLDGDAGRAGVVDARFIAILDTAIESPLGQISMIPMLAWIAKNAPPHLKATFFAVMASFTNLALSAASLGTKYLNQIFAGDAGGPRPDHRQDRGRGRLQRARLAADHGGADLLSAAPAHDRHRPALALRDA